MRTVKRLLIAVLCLVSVVFVGTRVARARAGRDVAPEISCDQSLLEVSVLQDEQVLLTGMTAFDRQDGDLTDQILVAGTSKLIGEDTATVTYLVFDSDDNMASFTRTIRYLDYHRPEITVTGPMCFSRDGSAAILECLSATDVIDGDISQQIRISTLRATEDSSIYVVVAQVTNSMGDTARVELPVVLMESDPARPEIELREYLVYVEQDSDFQPGRYVKGVSVGQKELSVREVAWDSEVDTSQPGTYWVKYTCENAGSVGMTMMTVVVEPKEGEGNE